MEEIKKKINKVKGQEISEILKKYNYEVYNVENLDECKEKVLSLIPKGSSIGLGGSVTIGKMGLVPIFREEYNLFDRYNQPTWDMTVQVMRESLLADFFITGTNAITKNGELVQTDSGGNRVASFLYGPKEVIVISGVNKVVENLQEAFERIREYAAPLNSKRLNHKTPCNITGKCENCTTKQRICNYTSIVNNGMRMGRKIKVIIINEEVGY